MHSSQTILEYMLQFLILLVSIFTFLWCELNELRTQTSQDIDAAS